MPKYLDPSWKKHITEWSLVNEPSKGEDGSRTWRYNHDDCPAGTDTRRRLYVTVDKANNWLAYCHNCGGKGFHRDKDTPNIHQCTSSMDGNESPPLKLTILDHWGNASSVYGILHADFNYSPGDIQEYLYSFGVSPLTAMWDEWRWCGKGDYLYLMFPFESGLTGVQVKSIGLRSDYPKVRTFGRMGIHIMNKHDCPILVICEDRISGAAIVEAGYSAAVLHGSRAIKPIEAHKLSTMYDKFVVWYDNDNTEVAKNAAETYKALGLFTSSIGRYCMEGKGEDPKYHDIDYIRMTVEELTSD